MTLVIDANVLLDAVHGGARRPLARAVLERTDDAVAPPLWRSEVRNAVVTMWRTGRTEFPEALRILEQAQRLVNQPAALPSDRQVLEIAAAGRTSAYDAEYVALALLLGAPLVTSDRRLQQAFPGIALSPERWLAAL